MPVNSASRCFEKASTSSDSVQWKWMFRSWPSAGWCRRIPFSRARYGASVVPSIAAFAQSRGRYSYFSLSMFSSEPGRATFSTSS